MIGNRAVADDLPDWWGHCGMRLEWSFGIGGGSATISRYDDGWTTELQSRFVTLAGLCLVRITRLRDVQPHTNPRDGEFVARRRVARRRECQKTGMPEDGNARRRECQKTGMVVQRILNRTANHRTVVLVELPVDIQRNGQKVDDQIEIKIIDGSSVNGRCASGERAAQRTFGL